MYYEVTFGESDVTLAPRVGACNYQADVCVKSPNVIYLAGWPGVWGSSVS